jgi:hypothetical protein
MSLATEGNHNDKNSHVKGLKSSHLTETVSRIFTQTDWPKVSSCKYDVAKCGTIYFITNST